MNSVKFDLEDHQRFGESGIGPMDHELILTNVSGEGPGRLRTGYERVTARFYRAILRSLYAVAGDYPFQIGKPRWIYVVTDDDERRFGAEYTLVGNPDGETIEVAVVDYVDEPSEVSPVAWDPQSAVTVVTVETAAYVEAVVAAAEEYVSLYREHVDGELDERVAILIEDARAIRDAMRTRDDPIDFRFGPEDERVRNYLYGDQYPDSALAHFLVETGFVRDEVERLRDRDDDEVSDKFQALLSHESTTIQAAVAGALEDNPDERAQEWLLGRRWTDDPEVVPTALRAAARTDGPDVADALRETVDFSSQPTVRQTAVRLLRNYPDHETIETLERATTEDDSEAVREAAREALAELRAEG